MMGWVECRRKLIDDQTWEAVINLDFVYLGRDYQAFGRLFGVRNTAEVQPIAARRGLPVDSSSHVKKEAAAPGFYAHSWITWQELQTSEWEADHYWQPLMKVLEILASLYGEENVRLIVWFEY